MIGKTITIKEAKNASLKGKNGKVIDETKHTIRIKTHEKHFTIIKDQLIAIEEQ